MITPNYPLRLLLAVTGYLALYVLGNNVAWALRTQRSDRLGQAVAFVKLWGKKLFLDQVLRLLYYLVGPYLVLYWGWASPLDLGLANLDWISGTGWTVAIGLVSSLLFVLLWWQSLRLVGRAPVMPQTSWLTQPWGWAFALREAIFLESWWALCRSPMRMLAGPYFGVYLGLATVVVAGLLNARTRHELSLPGFREDIVLTGSIAVVTATLYVFVENLWLCFALHFLLRVVVLQVVQRGMTREVSGEEQLAT